MSDKTARPYRQCALTRSVVGTDALVICEIPFRHHGPHTGVYDNERYSWPHDPRCIRLVGAPDNREFCDCRTLQMIDNGPDLLPTGPCCEDGPPGHTEQQHHDASPCYDQACPLDHPHGGPFPHPCANGSPVPLPQSHPTCSEHGEWCSEACTEPVHDPASKGSGHADN